MSNPPVAFNHEPPDLTEKPAGHDDMSDVTGNLGRRADPIDQEMTSKVLKFSFVYSGSKNHQVAPNVIHTHWMQAAQESLGDDIIIINNHNRPVEQISTIKWTDPTIHQKQFKLYQKTTGQADRRSTTYFILHRIQTNETISNIKALPRVRSIMKEYNCYVTDHQWTETQWDTTRIGFVTNYDPSFFNRTQAAAKFNEVLHSKPLGKKAKIPLFRMVFTSPHVKHATHTVSTKAYAIEVLHEDSVQMLLVLKTLLNATPAFVPYSMRRKYPEGYEKAIRFQTQLLTTSMVVILQNITTDMMLYLQPRIGEVAGVREMIPSPKGVDTGRYSVLVDKSAFHQVRATLIKALPQWIRTDVPSDAMPLDDYFLGSARVKPLFDDGLSSGENSWMTQSNASLMSMDLPPGQNDDYFRASTNVNQVFSYADAVGKQSSSTTFIGGDNTVTTTKASISEFTATRTEADAAQQQAFDRLTAQHQQDAIKAAEIIDAQRQEIEQLKAQRLEDIEIRNRDAQAAQAKEMEQDAATHRLRKESVQTQLEVSELRKDMQSMMQQMMTAFTTASASQEIKRSNDNNEDDSTPSEKRRDVRTTPGKKLFYDEMDLRDSPMYLTAMEADRTKNQQKDE